jgi:hypothetical protein
MNVCKFEPADRLVRGIVKKLFKAAALTISTTSGVTLAQPLAPRPDFKSTKSAPASSSNNVNFQLSLGTGQFPVLEMPVMRNSDARVDGSTNARDFSQTNGALLDLKLGWMSKSSAIPYSLTAGAQRMSATPGGVSPTPATYARLSAEAASIVSFDSTGTSIVPAIETRRDMYRNVDSGHYIDAILLKSSVEQTVSNTIRVNANAGIAPWTSFGVLQNSDRGRSGALKDTTASMSEIGSKVIWTPEETTSFHFGVSQEMVSVRMNSESGYRDYGLPVANQDNTSSAKAYDLTVRQVTLGTTKRF